MLVPKTICVQKNFNPKIFWVQKCCVKKLVERIRSKKCWVKEIVGPENFWSKKMLGSKKFCQKNLLVEKDLGIKEHLSPKKYCPDKSHRGNWNLFKRVPGTHLSSLVKMCSVTADVFLTLSLCGGWVVEQSHFIVKPNLGHVRLS